MNIWIQSILVLFIALMSATSSARSFKEGQEGHGGNPLICHQGINLITGDDCDDEYNTDLKPWQDPEGSSYPQDNSLPQDKTLPEYF